MDPQDFWLQKCCVLRRRRSSPETKPDELSVSVQLPGWNQQQCYFHTVAIQLSCQRPALAVQFLAALEMKSITSYRFIPGVLCTKHVPGLVTLSEHWHKTRLLHGWACLLEEKRRLTISVPVPVTARTQKPRTSSQMLEPVCPETETHWHSLLNEVRMERGPPKQKEGEAKEASVLREQDGSWCNSTDKLLCAT